MFHLPKEHCEGAKKKRQRCGCRWPNQLQLHLYGTFKTTIVDQSALQVQQVKTVIRDNRNNDKTDVEH